MIRFPNRTATFQLSGPPWPQPNASRPPVDCCRLTPDAVCPLTTWRPSCLAYPLVHAPPTYCSSPAPRSRGSARPSPPHVHHGPAPAPAGRSRQSAGVPASRTCASRVQRKLRGGSAIRAAMAAAGREPRRDVARFIYVTRFGSYRCGGVLQLGSRRAQGRGSTRRGVGCSPEEPWAAAPAGAELAPGPRSRTPAASPPASSARSCPQPAARAGGA